MHNTDVLVIGSGIAGLSYAIKVATSFPDKKVTIITKADDSETNTKYAQGGIAVVLNKTDSFDDHVHDTLKAGDGLCDREVVNFVVNEGPQRLKELIELGAQFDLNESGGFDLGREGGHTVHRIIHHKDTTGREMERILLLKAYALDNIDILAHHFVIDLITEHQLGKITPTTSGGVTCYGAYVLNEKTNKIEKHASCITLLASGGAGQVYGHTTNPAIATGDGIAIAHRANAVISDMEFVQFHPTALYQPGRSPLFLISEAVRGFGAKLKTKGGEEFMHKYDSRKELASRDIVAKAIDSEMKILGDQSVFLDCRFLDSEKFKSHFPNIYQKCSDAGINIEKDMIPVVPVAHYFCGGIKVDYHGRTSIKNLLACGECARTGLHGANRLASNSLLEALVFAERCHLQTVKDLNKEDYRLFELPDYKEVSTVRPNESAIISKNIHELQALMRNHAGIVRSNEGLKRALGKLESLYTETESLYKTTKLTPRLCELRNMVTVAHLIVSHSLKRNENRGLFWNVDLS
ncbi:MAG TPA: L-aspartate oxidase [Fulvivirga sp.]|nr:L-aspartate oxidase [Fulvivirga sp.]